MKKIKIEIPVLLPSIPDEKDQCVTLLIENLENESGVEKAHVEDGSPAQICIHYHPDIISINKVKKIAGQTGAVLTYRFQHALLNVKGIRHQRHARRIEGKLLEIEGIIEAAASASGVLRLEWDTEKIKEADVIAVIEKTGLKISKETKGEHDKHEHEKGDSHDHVHGGILGENTELYFAIGSGVFWLTGLILSFQSGIPETLTIGLFVVALILGGYFTLMEAIETIRKGKFEIDFLMLVAAAGAASLGKWEEGALLLFLFSLGHALENYAMNKARKSIVALSDLAPPTALVKRNGETAEVGIEEMTFGDIIVVKPKLQNCCRRCDCEWK